MYIQQVTSFHCALLHQCHRRRSDDCESCRRPLLPVSTAPLHPLSVPWLTPATRTTHDEHHCYTCRLELFSTGPGLQVYTCAFRRLVLLLSEEEDCRRCGNKDTYGKTHTHTTFLLVFPTTHLVLEHTVVILSSACLYACQTSYSMQYIPLK